MLPREQGEQLIKPLKCHGKATIKDISLAHDVLAKCISLIHSLDGDTLSSFPEKEIELPTAPLNLGGSHGGKGNGATVLRGVKAAKPF